MYRDGHQFDSNVINGVPLANIRLEYEVKIRGIKEEAKKFLDQGFTEDTVAKWAVNQRDKIKNQYKNLTSQNVRLEIEERNAKIYENSYDLTLDHTSFRKIMECNHRKCCTPGWTRSKSIATRIYKGYKKWK